MREVINYPLEFFATNLEWINTIIAPCIRKTCRGGFVRMGMCFGEIKIIIIILIGVGMNIRAVMDL